MSEKKESKFKKWITLLKENPVSPKLKKIAWFSNFLAVAAFVFLNIVLWYFVSYKNSFQSAALLYKSCRGVPKRPVDAPLKEGYRIFSSLGAAGSA